MDLALDNLQRLICHKTQQNKLNQINSKNADFKFMKIILKNYFVILKKILLFIEWLLAWEYILNRNSKKEKC